MTWPLLLNSLYKPEKEVSEWKRSIWHESHATNYISVCLSCVFVVLFVFHTCTFLIFLTCNIWHIFQTKKNIDFFFPSHLHKKTYGTSNKYLQHMFSWRNQKNSSTFQLKNKKTKIECLIWCSSYFRLFFFFLSNFFTFIHHKSKTRGPWWPCNAHLSIIALWEPDLELIKANILIKIQNNYINK